MTELVDGAFTDSDKINLLFKKFMGVSCSNVEQPFKTEAANSFNNVLPDHVWAEASNIPEIPPLNQNNFDVCGIQIDETYTRAIQYYKQLKLVKVTDTNLSAWRDPLTRNFLSSNSIEDISLIKNENLEISIFDNPNLTGFIGKFYTKNIINVHGIHYAKNNSQTDFLEYPFTVNKIFKNNNELRNTIKQKIDLIYNNLTDSDINNKYTSKNILETDINLINPNTVIIGKGIIFENMEVTTKNLIDSKGISIISNKEIEIISSRGSVPAFDPRDDDISFAYSLNKNEDNGWQHLEKNTMLEIDDKPYIKVYKYIENVNTNSWPNDASNNFIFYNIDENVEMTSLPEKFENHNIIRVKNQDLSVSFEFLNSDTFVTPLKDLNNTISDDFSNKTILKIEVLMIDERQITGYIPNWLKGNRLQNALSFPFSTAYGSTVEVFGDNGNANLPSADSAGGDWLLDPSTGILTFHSYKNVTGGQNDLINDDKPPLISFFRYIGKTGVGETLDSSLKDKIDTNNINILNNANVKGTLIVDDKTLIKGDLTLKKKNKKNVFYFDSNLGKIHIGNDDNDNLSLYDSNELNENKFVLDVSGNIKGDNAEFGDTIQAREIITWSDLRLKKNVCQMELNMENVSKLRGVHFVWKDTGKEDIGFIAQEVESIFPQIVHNTREQFKAISYEKMIPILLEYIKNVENRLKYLEERLSKNTF